MSRSRSSAATTTEQTNESTNINLQDVDGPAVGSAGGDVTITTTDFGALDAAEEISGAAFSLGEQAIDTNLKAVDSALDFGGTAIDAVSDATDRSLDFGEAALDQSFNFGSQALSTVAKSSADTAKTLSGAIEQAAAATRSDSADTLNKITKTGGIVLAVMAAAIAAIFIFKK